MERGVRRGKDTVREAAKRVVVIGLDGAIAKRVYQFAQDGSLPHVRKLIDQGVYAKNCMVPFPTITPPNWTTIATGAWPGTHGLTCFNYHKPGDPLDWTIPAFHSSMSQAEYIWHAAERVGKKSIIINYPSTWPPAIKEGIQIGGKGVGPNEWHLPGGFVDTLADEDLFSVEDYPQAITIELSPASGWEGELAAQSKEGKDLEAELIPSFRRAAIPVKPKRWHLLVQDTAGAGYDRIVISPCKNTDQAIAVLGAGDWSPTIVDEFETEQGTRKAGFRIKLEALAPDAEDLRIYVPGFCALDGWAYPKSIADEIKSERGLPITTGGIGPLNMEWIGFDTYVEVMDLLNTWLGDAANYLLSNKPWDLFFMHVHCMDWAYHAFGSHFDQLTEPDAQVRERYLEAELALYQSLDRMIGHILEAADEETLVIIVSDHGAKATGIPFHVRDLLEKSGLTVYEDGDEGERVVDWSKTKAVAQRSCYIYVNLKGRDPDGIVEPGEEYEKVRDQIIATLYDHTDPATGKKPIVWALRREDARVLGLYGENIGDVIYAVGPEFAGQHGMIPATAEYGVGSLMGLLIMFGLGIKKGEVLERTVWLTDLAPTICYLAELPLPKDAEGGIIYQALENPNLKLDQLHRLREDYQRLKKGGAKSK